MVFLLFLLFLCCCPSPLPHPSIRTPLLISVRFRKKIKTKMRYDTRYEKRINRSPLYSAVLPLLLAACCPPHGTISLSKLRRNNAEKERHVIAKARNTSPLPSYHPSSRGGHTEAGREGRRGEERYAMAPVALYSRDSRVRAAYSVERRPW